MSTVRSQLVLPVTGPGRTYRVCLVRVRARATICRVNCVPYYRSQAGRPGPVIDLNCFRTSYRPQLAQDQIDHNWFRTRPAIDLKWLMTSYRPQPVQDQF